MMKKNLILLFLVFGVIISFGQTLPDSVISGYRSAKTNEEKANFIDTYTNKISESDTSEISRIMALSSWFNAHNDAVGSDYTELKLGYILLGKGDHAAALDLLLPVLHHFEERQDTAGMWNAYSAICSVYYASKSYELAAEYFKKIIPLVPASEGEQGLSEIYNGIACFYGEGEMPDSGMIYAQKAVKIDTELQNFQQLAVSISTLGENYIAAKEYEIALPFLRKSQDLYRSGKAEPNEFLTAYLNNDFAQIFLATHQLDSVIHYSNLALLTSIPFGFKDQSMRSYEYLYKSFETTGQQDSVNKYFRLAMTLKDSIIDLEKIKSIQALSFREELRQQEKETEKAKAAEERRLNIQFALIALGIIAFIILFLLLSRSFITNTKLIRFFGVIALLIVFEFLNLLLHPFLERITHHSPVLMLFALVCIAALLVPLHHRAEKWAMTRLVEKNKEIRLAQARKTIELLGDIPSAQKS